MFSQQATFFSFMKGASVLVDISFMVETYDTNNRYAENLITKL